MNELVSALASPDQLANAALLGPGQVDLWQVDLDSADASVDAPRAVCLSAHERRRASRFAFERDRGRYVAATIALRTILSAYSDVPAAMLRFERHPHGKPYLEMDVDWMFNLSHSQHVGLIAISREEVGVDLEVLRTMHQARDLAQRFFTPAEARAIDLLSGTRRERAFFNCWTRKEACFKATGVGLTGGLNKLEVGIEPAEAAVAVVHHGKAAVLNLSSLQLPIFDRHGEEQQAIAAVARLQFGVAENAPLNEPTVSAYRLLATEMPPVNSPLRAIAAGAADDTQASDSADADAWYRLFKFKADPAT